METEFENLLQKDLHQYLLSKNLIDGHLPECPDVENKWTEIGAAYLADGVREFNAYPTVSLGWCMFLGMAMAQFWDENWEYYGNAPQLYESLREQRSYDCMDEYILEDILHLNEVESQHYTNFVAECASRTYNRLHHLAIEPGTPAAFHAYQSAIHQLYLMGMAVQLHTLGYHMNKVE